MIMRARCTAGSPGWVPVRRPPTSTSTSTLSTLPAAAMACPSSRTLSTLSTTAMVSGACSSTPKRRRIFSGPTTSVVMRMLRMPAAAITSASPTLAQQMPTAPAAIWRRAISGHLCVLEWGRSFLPADFTCAAILAMLRSKRSTSRSSAGVGISLRVMAWRAYHGSLYDRRHDHTRPRASWRSRLVWGKSRHVSQGEGGRALRHPRVLLPRGRLALWAWSCSRAPRGASPPSQPARGAERLRHRQRPPRPLSGEQLRRLFRRVQGRRGPAVHGLRPARRRGRLRRPARQLHGVGQGTRGGGVAVLGRSRRALHGEHPEGAVGHGQARAPQPLRGRSPRDRHRERPSPQGPTGAARVRGTTEQYRLPRLLGDVDQDVAARSLMETRQWTRSSSGG